MTSWTLRTRPSWMSLKHCRSVLVFKEWDGDIERHIFERIRLQISLKDQCKSTHLEKIHQKTALPPVTGPPMSLLVSNCQH